MLEKTIEKLVSSYATKNKILNFKFTSLGHRSLPDRIFFTPIGDIFFIEFKREGKEPTELQDYTIKKLRSYNTTVYVVDNVRYGKQIIDNYVRITQLPN